MITPQNDQVENTSQEIQALKERIAFLEGRREGSARVLNIVVPVAAALLAMLSFAILIARINAVMDSSIRSINAGAN